MFKGRIGIWISVLVAAIVLQFLVIRVPVWLESDDVIMSVSVDKDADLNDVLANSRICKINITLRDSDPDIIITEKNEVHVNYEKYSDFIYSPLVMYATNVSYDDEGFIGVPSSSNCYKVDLKNILIAMQDGKEWKDLGFNKDVINGKITLYIPSEDCAYYENVVDLFYLTLNNGKDVDAATKEQLEPKVKELLKKCKTVSDMSQAIEEEAENESKTHKVFIGPEYLYQRDSSTFSAESDYKFRPVYFKNTVYLKANVYVKKSTTDDKTAATRFVNNMQESYKFLSYVGWRTKDSVYDVHSSGYVYINNP